VLIDYYIQPFMNTVSIWYDIFTHYLTRNKTRATYCKMRYGNRDKNHLSLQRITIDFIAIKTAIFMLKSLAIVKEFQCHCA